MIRSRTRAGPVTACVLALAASAAALPPTADARGRLGDRTLREAGLLRGALDSGGFTRYGLGGPGEWITVYAHGGHAYLVIAGLRFDTSGRGERGPRWQPEPRTGRGYRVRHPEGL